MRTLRWPTSGCYNSCSAPARGAIADAKQRGTLNEMMNWILREFDLEESRLEI